MGDRQKPEPEVGYRSYLGEPWGPIGSRRGKRGCQGSPDGWRMISCRGKAWNVKDRIGVTRR